jgi:hypothetical protein
VSWPNRSWLARVLAQVVIGAALAGALPIVSAEMIATPLRGDSRLVEFVHDRDNTYLVLAKPKAVTHIQFAADEVIQSVAAGDTANWEFTPTRNRRNLFVKPRFDDQETSLTVITDKRSYQFVLRSTGDGKKWYQRVSWIYNGELVLTMEGLPEAKPTSPETQAPAAPPQKAASPRSCVSDMRSPVRRRSGRVSSSTMAASRTSRCPATCRNCQLSSRSSRTRITAW